MTLAETLAAIRAAMEARAEVLHGIMQRRDVLADRDAIRTVDG